MHSRQSVILEKEAEVTTDPRGVFLTGDAVRVLHSLGINDLTGIGHGRSTRANESANWVKSCTHL